METLHRKVIQISVIDGLMVALCDDGSLWARDRTGWDMCPPVPGSDPKLFQEFERQKTDDN